MRSAVLIAFLALLFGVGIGFLWRAQRSEAPPQSAVGMPPDMLDPTLASITLDVRQPDGKPAEAASVYLSRDAAGSEDLKLIDWTATRHRARLAPGTYWTWARRASPVPLASSKQRVEVDKDTPSIVLHLKARPGIHGRIVTPEPLVVPTARVWALRFAGDVPPDTAKLPDNAAVVGGDVDAGLRRYAFPDLEPGRYLVALFLAGRDVGATAVVDVTDAPAECALTVPPFSREEYLMVRARNAHGKAVSRVKLFQTWQEGEVSISRAAPLVRRDGGGWYVPKSLGGESESGRGRFSVTLRSNEYGDLERPYTLDTTDDMVIELLDPARLRLTIEGFSDQRLPNAAVYPATAVSRERVRLDGRGTPVPSSGVVTLPPFQPGPRRLVLASTTERGTIHVMIQSFELTIGVNEHAVRVPALHELHLEAAGATRAVLTCIGEDGGWLHQTSSVDKEGTIVFRYLVPGRYVITADVEGTPKSREVTVPAQGVVRWKEGE